MRREAIEEIGELLDGRKWGVAALVLLVLTVACFVASVQVLGDLNISLSYARHASMPHWASVYIRVLGYCCLLAFGIDIVGLILDRRKGIAWGVLAGCVLSFAGMGSAFE
jgi:hypothetical protein